MPDHEIPRLVSFSLWGTDPKYTLGALRNAELMHEFYPDWEARFYCGQSVPQEIIHGLVERGGKIMLMQEQGDWQGMFWRFLAAADPKVEVVIFRDTDSRLGSREAAAVDAWLASGKLFHMMRDHPAHTFAIPGGMWGVRKPLLANINELIPRYKGHNRWGVDQDFLRDMIWPLVKPTALVHDSVYGGTPFPVEREGTEFVGQIYDEHDEPSKEAIYMMNNYLRFYAQGLEQEAARNPGDAEPSAD